MFDIRDYKKNIGNDSKANVEKMYWSEAYLRKVDAGFPYINKECEDLVNHMTPESEDAFNHKLDLWSDFTETLQKLCKIYKIEDAKCLSNEN